MINQRTVENVTIFEPNQTLQTEVLQQQVQSSLAEKKAGCIAIDLSQVSYIDSAGLGVLVSLHKQCEAQQSMFALYGLQAYVQRLVEVIRLNRVLRIFENETATIAALSNTGNG